MCKPLATIVVILVALAPLAVGADVLSEKRKANMARTPIETVEEMYRLFSAGDMEATFALVADDYSMFEPGPQDILPWAGHFEGREGFQNFNAKLTDSISTISISNTKFENIGKGRVMVTGVETATSSSTGKNYRSESLWIWTVQNGKIISMRAYHDTEAMASAFRP